MFRTKYQAKLNFANDPDLPWILQTKRPKNYQEDCNKTNYKNWSTVRSRPLTGITSNPLNGLKKYNANLGKAAVQQKMLKERQAWLRKRNLTKEIAKNNMSGAAYKQFEAQQMRETQNLAFLRIGTIPINMQNDNYLQKGNYRSKYIVGTTKKEPVRMESEDFKKKHTTLKVDTFVNYNFEPYQPEGNWCSIQKEPSNQSKDAKNKQIEKFAKSFDNYNEITKLKNQCRKYYDTDRKSVV